MDYWWPWSAASHGWAEPRAAPPSLEARSSARRGQNVVSAVYPPGNGRVYGGCPESGDDVLTDEGEVVVAAGGVSDGRATVNGDAEVGGVEAIAAVDDGIGIGVADADGITDVAATVDVAGGDGAAARGGCRHTTVPR